MTISNLLKTAIVSLLAVANLSIPAFASSDIHFDSNVYMERAVRIQGQTQRQLVVPPYIARGDHLVLKMDYQKLLLITFWNFIFISILSLII